MRLRWTSQAKDVSALMDMVSCLIKSVDTVIKRQNDLQETLNDKEAECTTLRDENRRSSEAWLHIWLLPTSRPLIVDISSVFLPCIKKLLSSANIIGVNLLDTNAKSFT